MKGGEGGAGFVKQKRWRLFGYFFSFCFEEEKKEIITLDGIEVVTLNGRSWGEIINP